MAGKPKYRTPAEMQAVIDEYFERCKGNVLRNDEGEMIFDKFGHPVMENMEPPTITNLALALGFASRQALLNYEARKAFNDTVTRAKARIEGYAEQRLFDRDGQRGAEFSLRCNFGWNDKAAAKSENNREDDKLSAALLQIAEALDAD